MTKITTSILKMKMNHKLPSAGKRSQSSYRLQSLPPSLMKLPKISSSSSSHLSPRSSWSNNVVRSLDQELNETRLDEWLVRLNEVVKASEEERSTGYIKREVSEVSFATTTTTTTLLSSPPSSATTRAAPLLSPLEQQPPANKRRRFSRRNSFIIRDLAQLVGRPSKIHEM
jgi:hypothetical protein